VTEDFITCPGKGVGRENGYRTDIIGIFRDGFQVLDYNGNFQWDGPAPDRVVFIGEAGDVLLVGTWKEYKTVPFFRN